MPAASPCVKICVIDETTGLCEGCCRTLDEIARWSVMDDAGQRDTLRRIEERRNKQRGRDARETSRRER